MKRLSRLLSLLLILCLMIAFTACSRSTREDVPAPDPGPVAGASSADTSATNPAGETDDTYRVGVFYYSFADAYISSMRPMIEGALDEAGISYQIFDGGNNQITQNEQIEMALSLGYDLLIVNLVTSGYADVAEEVIARAGDVPVIFFNRAIEADGEEGVVLGVHDSICFIGTDPPEAGHLQGQMIGDYLVAHFDAVDLNRDGEISYAMFKGEDANVEAIYRTRYSVEDADAILRRAGRKPLRYFDESNADCYQVDLQGSWSEQAAYDYMVANLSQYNEKNGNMIELVICNNDDMAKGVISALENNGYNTGRDSATVIPVFGVDATQTARGLIADHKMAGTVKQDADGMAQAICTVCSLIAEGMPVQDAVRVTAEGTATFSLAEGLSNKLVIDYAPYTGE